LLALLNIPFEVRNPLFDEELKPNISAIEQVKSFAVGKARSVATQEPEAVVLGSDTVIELEHQVLGKPVDVAEARAMLRLLAGRSHHVHTAVALVSVRRAIEFVELSTATVRMKRYDEQAHERYLATGDSLGKAGGYSIQGEGGELIASIEGDFPTVVGLPLRVVATLLRQAGLVVPVDTEALYATKSYPNWVRFSSVRPS